MQFRRRRRNFEFFDGKGPSFSFGLERAVEKDFDSARSPIFERREALFSARLKEHVCFVYRPEGDAIASYFWVSEPGAVVPLTPWLGFRIPSGRAYIWDCKTDVRFRGRGFYTNGLREIISVRRCLISVEGNPSARKAVQNAGFTSVGNLTTLNLGPVNVIDGKIVIRHTISFP
jgi:hypothetical protein